MDLVRSASWLTSFFDKPVIYETPLLTMIQDYMKSEVVKLWVYERIRKKRRQLSLRIPATTRDQKKSFV